MTGNSMSCSRPAVYCRLIVIKNVETRSKILVPSTPFTTIPKISAVSLHFAGWDGTSTDCFMSFRRSQLHMDFTLLWSDSVAFLHRQSADVLKLSTLFIYLLLHSLIVLQRIYCATSSLSSIIVVQWKMIFFLKGNSYWRDPHFKLNHDYGRKANLEHKKPLRCCLKAKVLIVCQCTFHIFQGFQILRIGIMCRLQMDPVLVPKSHEFGWICPLVGGVWKCLSCHLLGGSGPRTCK